MKKFTFVLAAALISLGAAAVELNNPTDANGRYIVKWDCAKGDFAAANDFEPGETVTLAFDITDTKWEEAVKSSPVEGATRGMAANIWTNYGPKKDDTNRLKQIKGNIYGATFNLAQCIADNSAEEGAKIKKDTIVYCYGQLFMFAYGMVNDKFEPGMEWYVEADGVQAPGSDCLFATLPSTGRFDEDFYSDDFTEDMFTMKIKGYAAPCVVATAIEDAAVEGEKAGKFIENGQLYILHNGVKYNALGAIVKYNAYKRLSGKRIGQSLF